MESQADKITPLVINPGRILLSTERLYFQPYNNIEPVSKNPKFQKFQKALNKNNNCSIQFWK